MRSKLYFGHPINTYGTKLEELLLTSISQDFAASEIENPNQPKHQEGYKKFREEKSNGMLYFTEAVLPECSGGIFLPFRDGKWGAGVAKEALYFIERGFPVWEIGFRGNLVVTIELSREDFRKDRVLSAEETRAYIRDNDGNTLPY